MSEPKPNDKTDVQIPLFEPIVEESVDVTREQPALGAEPRGPLAVECVCGHRGNVKAEYAGRMISCPKCRKTMRAPL